MLEHPWNDPHVELTDMHGKLFHISWYWPTIKLSHYDYLFETIEPIGFRLKLLMYEKNISIGAILKW